MCKDVVNKDSTIQSDVKTILPASQKNFKFPVSRLDDRAIPSGRPSAHCSIRPDDVSSRPDARQTSIICPDEVFIPSGPHTISRSLCASLHPSGRLSVLKQSQILSKFQ